MKKSLFCFILLDLAAIRGQNFEGPFFIIKAKLKQTEKKSFLNCVR